MSVEEAHKVLGAESGAPPEELLRRYNHLFRANDESGSFYLASKVWRAREAIEAERGPLEEQGGGGAGAGADPGPPPPQGRVTDGHGGGA